MLRSRLGKRHRQNFVGKSPPFVPSGSRCVDRQTHFYLELPDVCLFVYGCVKRKKTQFVSTSGHSLGPCYFWNDFKAALC